MYPPRSKTPTDEIEPFRSSDRSAFLSLYETVFGIERSTDWFRWKYVENPVADHVPIVVARRDGDLIGARSFLPVRVAVDGVERVAYQPCDTMVHPDHRRQGVFTRMNEAAIERYAAGEPAFFFNFPNGRSKPGNLKLGWREVGTVPMYYRPQKPVSAAREWIANRTDRIDEEGAAASELLERVATDPVADAHRAIDRRLGGATDGLTIDRYERPTEAPLEPTYRRAVPEGVHTVRDRAFYEWRFDNPANEYGVYVASRDGTPVAALIVSLRAGHLRLVDALPRSVDDDPEPLERLVAAALTDRAAGDDVGYVAAFGDVLPRPLRYRFYPDTRFPLSALIRPTTRSLLVRDLDRSSTVASRSLEDWTLSWFDLDAV
ncbi:GNAT family N-acetyltransferase [Halovivax sp.]|uniref:GNAT family N-acetyltransferase n=1 Tax=Halovivax sp. TaxID=1935978 RepID=UPI0025C064A1|nr:GNAT family N-acetyltransferase [Halovivax sp.]